jgi:putative ABC transport system permease protein
MRWLIGARERLLMMVFRGREDVEMDEELRFHLDMETAQNIRLGMPPGEARRQARLALGGLERHREALREGRRWTLLEDVWRDVRYGTRSLLRVPGFTAPIVVALALGIGTSVMVFGVVRQLVTDAVPFAQPDRLFSVNMVGPRGVGVDPSSEDFGVWRGEVAAVGRLAGYAYRPRAIGDGMQTTYSTGFSVTEDFFAVLAARPLLGRTLGAEDHLPSSPAVVVLAEPIWAKHFGGEEGIVGQGVLIDGQPHVVAGVVPAGLQFPAVADFWTPLPAGAPGTREATLGVIGRLAPGRTMDEARVALETVQGALDAARPESEGAGRVELLPLSGRDPDRAEIPLLQGTVLLVLLIGIANGAGLMLTRGMRRRREIAVRASLGASRLRIVRQILTESALLAAAGGVFGLGVGWVGIELLKRGLPPAMTRQMLGWDQLGLDTTAAVLALVLATATALACGLMPALHAVRGDPSAGLKEEGTAAPAGRAAGRVTHLLVVAEVALSLTLLLTAGLLTRSLVELVRSDTGYDAEGVLTAQWVLPAERYGDDGAVERLQNQLLERVRAIAGVTSAAIVSTLPTAPFGETRRYRATGADPDTEGRPAAWRPISHEYLSVMGIELVRGRPFGSADGATAERVTIVDESLAATLQTEGRDAMGSRIHVDGEAWAVVGVARTVVNPAYPGAARRTMYVPQPQAPTRSGFIVVRAAGEAPGLARQVNDAVWSVDPAIAIGATATVAQIAADLRWSQRVMAIIIAAFALIALVITIISLYTLVAYTVARRQREFGIRLALGAGPHVILRDAMARGMVWVAVGTALGIALSAGVARLLTRLLYGIQPLDPVVFTLVPVAVLALALLASYVPARRAARVDPLRSLNLE